ncbi:tRNA-dihydrouridine synthase [Streptomyces sp. NPDC006334]|uniref:oxidoreductase n=1 Tax=Streptomyces sp. NPDC006334 TaxID=3156754 RepID=UPI0033AE73D7
MSGSFPSSRLNSPPDSKQPNAQQSTRTVREGAALPVSAVGLITAPEQADQILVDRSADAIMLARELLRNPTWPLHAAHVLGDDVPWPEQYQRGRPRHR